MYTLLVIFYYPLLHILQVVLYLSGGWDFQLYQSKGTSRFWGYDSNYYYFNKMHFHAFLYQCVVLIILIAHSTFLSCYVFVFLISEEQRNIFGGAPPDFWISSHFLQLAPCILQLCRSVALPFYLVFLSLFLSDFYVADKVNIFFRHLCHCFISNHVLQ